MKLFIILAALLGSLLASAMADGGSLDLTLINLLPTKREAAIRASSEKRLQTQTSPIAEGYYAYNESLAEMIKTLVSTYYGPGPGAMKVEDVDPMIERMYDLENNRQDALNPTGEWQGSAASIDVPRRISADLEALIVEMVQAITRRDRAFDMQQWKQKWERAAVNAKSGG